MGEGEYVQRGKVCVHLAEGRVLYTEESLGELVMKGELRKYVCGGGGRGQQRGELGGFVMRGELGGDL